MSGVIVRHRVRPGCAVINELPAFQRFAWTVGERCEDPPVATTVRRVGHYDGHHDGHYDGQDEGTNR